MLLNTTTRNKIIASTLVSSFLLAGILFYVEEKFFSFRFLQLNNDTLIWTLLSLFFWGLSTGLFFLFKNLKLPISLSLLLAFIVGFAPLFILIVLNLR